MCVGDFFPVWVLYRCGKCTSGGVCVIKMKVHVHVLICNTYHAHVLVIVTTRKRSLLLHLSFCSPGGGCLPLDPGGVSASGSGGGICLWVQGRVSASGSRGVTPPGHSLWTHTCPLNTHPDGHTPRHTPPPLWTRTHILDTPPPDIGH